MTISIEALFYYLSLKHVPSPLTIYDGRKKKRIITFPDLSWSPVNTLSEEQTIEKMEKLVWKGILKEIVGNVGFLTSGGIDSGITTAVGAKLSDKQIKTFCLLYDAQDETEGKKTDREYSKWISDIYKTKHTEHVISFKDFPEKMPQIMEIIGEPFSGYVSVYFITEFIKKHVDIALTGDWADELFGSYKIHRLAYENPSVDLSSLIYSTSVFHDVDKQYLLSSKAQTCISVYSTPFFLKGNCNHMTAKDSLNLMLEYDLNYLFPDHVFMSVDKLSKANGIEIRAPYAEKEFVEFAAKIPGELKMKGGETKYILKQLALRYLPKEIVFRKKEGFVTPTLPLVRSLKKYVMDTLSPYNLRKHGLFNVDYVQTLVEDFYKEESDTKAYKIWNLVCFQVWYDVCGENQCV